MGDHTEAVQVEYDPQVLPYEKVTELFFQQIDWSKPCGTIRQFRTAIWYQNQRERASIDRVRVLSACPLRCLVFLRGLVVSGYLRRRTVHTCRPKWVGSQSTVSVPHLRTLSQVVKKLEDNPEGKRVTTDVEPLKAFYRAEEYKQRFINGAQRGRARA